MIFEHSSYRHYLKCELADRIAKNASYSMRAFASHLEVSPATLSLVLAGKKNLSLETAGRISANLKLEPNESEYLNLLVQADSAKKIEFKEKILERLKAMNPKKERTDLTIEYFRVISDWYHYAILMLTEIKEFDFSPANLSKRLGISRYEVEMAIERMEKLELLERDTKNQKRYRRVKGDIVFKSDHTNEALRKYNVQILEKAIESVRTQTSEERLTGSEIVALSKRQFKELNKIMEEFFSKVLSQSGKSEKKTDVYCVGVQVFNLLKSNKELK